MGCIESRKLAEITREMVSLKYRDTGPSAVSRSIDQPDPTVGCKAIVLDWCSCSRGNPWRLSTSRNCEWWVAKSESLRSQAQSPPGRVGSQDSGTYVEMV
jgi:hypothetical protein